MAQASRSLPSNHWQSKAQPLEDDHCSGNFASMNELLGAIGRREELCVRVRAGLRVRDGPKSASRKRDPKIPWMSAHYTSERIEIKWRLFSCVRGTHHARGLSERQEKEEEAVIAFSRGWGPSLLSPPLLLVVLLFQLPGYLWCAVGRGRAWGDFGR